MKQIFISGMFRSGTTFLARMLNVHSRIVCASDPFRPLFNSFRFDIAKNSYKKNYKRFFPLDDYFLNNSELLDAILNSDLNIEIGCGSDELIENILNAAEPYSKTWCSNFDKTKYFTTYKEVLEYGLSLIQDTYGNKEYIAFKEVWTNEFIPAFLKTFKGSKAIIILRDPRAVVASNIASGEKYPLFFLTRQWRKLAYLTYLIKENFLEDILIVKYENLIANPEYEVKVITDFLKLPFEDNLLNIDNYKDGAGNNWKKNTHYKSDNNMNKIDSENINKWQNILSDKEIKMIELICKDWMNIYGYKSIYNVQDLITFNSYPKYNKNELAGWIKNFSFDEDKERFLKEILLEKMRLLLTKDEIKFLSSNEKQSLHLL